MSDIQYASAKLQDGVEALATGPGRIQRRLEAAWKLFFVRVYAADFPEGSDLRSWWDAVHEQVTSGGLDFAGIRKMDDDEAIDVATQMVRIQREADFLARQKQGRQ
jgi:hypothetical protein